MDESLAMKDKLNTELNKAESNINPTYESSMSATMT